MERHPANNRRLEENAALRRIIGDEIAALETTANTSADRMLENTEVSIDMENLEGPYTPPPAIINIFEATNTPRPQAITSLNLDLKYDRPAQQFSVLRGCAAFDNGYGVRVSDPYPLDDSPTSLLYHNLTFFLAQRKQRIKRTRLSYYFDYI